VKPRGLGAPNAREATVWLPAHQRAAIGWALRSPCAVAAAPWPEGWSGERPGASGRPAGAMRCWVALADTDVAVVTEPVLLQPVQQPVEGGLVSLRQ